MSDIELAEQRVYQFMSDMNEWERDGASGIVYPSCPDNPESLDAWMAVLRSSMQPLPARKEQELKFRRDAIYNRHCVGDHWFKEALAYGGTPPNHDPERDSVYGSTLLDDGRVEVFVDYHSWGSSNCTRIFMLHREGKDWKIARCFDVYPPRQGRESEEAASCGRSPRATAFPPERLEQLVPAFRGLARPAVRINPRYDPNVSPHASSLGGVFLANDAGSWPRCREHNTPLAAILQVLKADVPELGFPPDKDVFQLFWCPFDYAQEIAVRWLATNDVGAPQPHNPDLRRSIEDSVPIPCRLFPERALEHPDALELSEVLEREIMSCEELRRLGEKAGFTSEYAPVDAYQRLFRLSDQTKVGGYVDWIQSPEVPQCACGARMEHMLTVSSGDSTLCVGDLGSVYFFICRQCEAWPVKAVFQCT